MNRRSVKEVSKERQARSNLDLNLKKVSVGEMDQN